MSCGIPWSGGGLQLQKSLLFSTARPSSTNEKSVLVEAGASSGLETHAKRNRFTTTVVGINRRSRPTLQHAPRPSQSCARSESKWPDDSGRGNRHGEQTSSGQDRALTDRYDHGADRHHGA